MAVGAVRGWEDVDGHRGSDIAPAEGGACRPGDVPACDGDLLRQVRRGQDRLGGERQPCGGDDPLRRRSPLRGP